MHHAREGEALGKWGGGQFQVLEGEDIQHPVVLVIREDLDGTVVIAVKDLPVERQRVSSDNEIEISHLGARDGYRKFVRNLIFRTECSGCRSLIPYRKNHSIRQKENFLNAFIVSVPVLIRIVVTYVNESPQAFISSSSY